MEESIGIANKFDGAQSRSPSGTTRQPENSNNHRNQKVLNIHFNKKDLDKFDPSKHTDVNCKCGYHKNKELGITKQNNTIADVKFHTPLEDLTGKYNFLAWWIRYLYSLKPKQLPSYNMMLKKLKSENSNCGNMTINFERKHK